MDVRTRTSVAVKQTLSDRSQQMQRLLELSNFSLQDTIAVLFLNADLDVESASEQFTTFSSVAPPGHIGRSLRELMPTFADRVEPLCRDVLRTGQPIVDAEIEEAAPPDARQPRVCLVRARLVRDETDRTHVSLGLHDITHLRRRDRSPQRSSRRGLLSVPLLSALTAHIAFALDAEAVLIVELDMGADRVHTLASLVDAQPIEPIDGPFSGTLWEHAAETDLWTCAPAAAADEAFGSLHPRLSGMSVAGALIVSLRDSACALCGFAAVLTRTPFSDLAAAAASLQLLAPRASAELDRQRAEDQNRRLVSKLNASVRELLLVHSVGRILQRDDFAELNDTLREVVDAVRLPWPDPGMLGVRMRLGSVEVTAGVEDRLWSQRAAFSLADGRIGAIELAYADHDAGIHSTLLLDALADMLRRSFERNAATLALRASEERYRSVVENQSDLLCRFLADTTLTFVNEAYCRFFSRSRAELIGSRFVELIPPADRESVLQQIDALVRGEHPEMHEHSVIRPDGSLGRQQWINRAIITSDGDILEFQGIGRDITDRWRAEEALRGNQARLRDAYRRIRSLAQRLLLAHEAERTEIARDLHDDIGQQLAALSIELSVIEEQVRRDAVLASRVTRLRCMAGDLADKVRRTSHALHPGVLKHAGLVVALGSHCESVAAQHDINVAFEPDGRFDDVADEIAICVYRVAQQALRNIVMHADATRATVTLTRQDGTIRLVVADNGRGFDPSEAHLRGIGLMSIEERVSLVDGALVIESQPGLGSRIRIEVPARRGASA